MTWLIVGDTHFSDRDKDSYRFGLFKWLAKQQQKYDTQATFFLGDLTQEKDNHSSRLVNRIVDGLTSLKPPIYIVRGNHDGLDPECPYFRFVNSINGVDFIGNTKYIDDHRAYLVGHCRSQQDLDLVLAAVPAGTTVFCHQTFEGAISETGHRLSGLKSDTFKGPICAGDVHRPQTQGQVTYVGAPYPVRFGDSYRSRVLLLRADVGSMDLYFPAPQKLTLKVTTDTDLSTLGLTKGDQVKLTVSLDREEVVDWLAIKRSILATLVEGGVEVHGIQLASVASTLPKLQKVTHKTPESLLRAFCKAEKVSGTIEKAGLALIGG